MSFVALFTIGNIWKQPKCPSVDEWIKIRYIQSGILPSHKTDEISPFATTWMDLEGHYAE